MRKRGINLLRAWWCRGVVPRSRISRKVARFWFFSGPSEIFGSPPPSNKQMTKYSKFKDCAYLVICLFEGGGLLGCSPTLLQKWDDSTSLPQMGVEPLIAVKNLIRLFKEKKKRPWWIHLYWLSFFFPGLVAAGLARGGAAHRNGDEHSRHGHRGPTCGSWWSSNTPKTSVKHSWNILENIPKTTLEHP